MNLVISTVDDAFCIIYREYADILVSGIPRMDSVRMFRGTD